MDLLEVTYRVANFLPKLLDMLLFFTEKKLNYHFLYSPIYGCCLPSVCRTNSASRGTITTLNSYLPCVGPCTQSRPALPAPTPPPSRPALMKKSCPLRTETLQGSGNAEPLQSSCFVVGLSCQFPTLTYPSQVFQKNEMCA